MSDAQHVFDALAIDRMLKRMAGEILEAHQNTSDLALIGIHTRGVFLARRLRQHIKQAQGDQVSIGEIDITLYRDDWTQLSAQPVVKTTNIPFSMEGRQIILVDDVLYTGRTIRAAMDALMDFGRPARIELAVLIERGHRELPIQSNYTGHSLSTLRTQKVNVLLKECDGEDNVTIA